MPKSKEVSSETAVESPQNKPVKKGRKKSKKRDAEKAPEEVISPKKQKEEVIPPPNIREDEPNAVLAEKQPPPNMIEGSISESECNAHGVEPKTPATGFKKLLVSNLDCDVEMVDVVNFFKEAGKVINASLGYHPDGTFRGFAHVIFATAEAAQNALKLDKLELKGRPVKIDIVHDAGAHALSSNGKEDGNIDEFNVDESIEKAKAQTLALQQAYWTSHVNSAAERISETGCKTLFAGNLDYDLTKEDLIHFFREAGEVLDVCFKYHPDGASKGFAYVDFATAEAAKNALKLHRQQLNGRPINLDASARSDRPSSYIREAVNGVDDTTKNPLVDYSTLLVANLESAVKKKNLVKFFKKAGEVVDVRFGHHRDGTFRGFAYVFFAMAEAAQNALKQENRELKGRAVSIALTHKNWSLLTMVRGFDASIDQDEIRLLLQEHFYYCGEINHIIVPVDDESSTSGSKGIAFIDFEDRMNNDKAILHDGAYLGDRIIRVQLVPDSSLRNRC